MPATPRSDPAAIPVFDLPDFSKAATVHPNAVTVMIEHLDRIGFYVGGTHVSVLGALFVLLVLGGVIAFGRVGSRIAQISFARLVKLDPTQRLLGERSPPSASGRWRS